MIDTAAYKARLEKDFADITAELKELGIHNPQVKEDWIALPQGVDRQESDENVVADRAEDWIERRATLSELEARYNNLRDALARIENGTYGICEVCGEAIEAARLDANPTARTCTLHINDQQELSS